MDSLCQQGRSPSEEKREREESAHKGRVRVWESAVLDLGAAGVAEAAALRAADALVVLVAGVRLRTQETEPSRSGQSGSQQCEHGLELTPSSPLSSIESEGDCAVNV